MSERVEEYRARLEELRGQSNGRWRTPTSLRDEIAVWALNRRRSGQSAGSIAAAIGLGESTLAKWMSKREERGQLCRVRVDEQVTGNESLVLVTPDGFRLEGLNLDQAVNVLRRL